MKVDKWICGPALAVALGIGILGGSALAQPDANNPAKAENPAVKEARADRKERKQSKEAKAARKEIKRLEIALGQPLTEEQQQAVIAAQKAYQESLAKAVGLTLEELEAKERAATEKFRDEGKKAIKEGGQERKDGEVKDAGEARPEGEVKKDKKETVE